VDPTCPICRLETETITHVITSCPLYNEIRKEHFVKIKGTVITAIGFDCWKINFNKKDIICQLVILAFVMACLTSRTELLIESQTI
jgi:hypothetical protein